MADTLEKYEAASGKKEITLAKEMEILIRQDRTSYDSAEKRNVVLNNYVSQCVHNISGEQISVDISTLVQNLRERADWYTGLIRTQEWVTDENGNGWFNGYYDNHGRPVEGKRIIMSV